MDILQAVSEVAAGPVQADATHTDSAAAWPERGIRALQEAGLGGLVAPAQAGGLGEGLHTLVQACERLGQVCASTALCFGMHCVGTAVLAAKATEAQMQDLLGPIARGEHLTTLALSEPGNGAHFYFPETRLERSGDRYRLRGEKSFVTNGGHADSYVVSAALSGVDAHAGQFCCVVVPHGAAQMAWGEPWLGLGMRGNSSRSVQLDDVSVPASHLLGEEGDQLWYVFNVVAPYFLAAMAGTYLGVAQAALDRARAWLLRRSHSHSGTGLADIAVLQHRFGTLWSQVERTRQFIYFAAREGDADGPKALPALCSAKAEVADCVVSVVGDVMTLVGGMGYRDDGVLGRLLRDARASHIMAPTTDLLRLWTGRVLLDKPVLG